MVKNSKRTTLLAALAVTMASISPLQAQFDRYRTGTKFDDEKAAQNSNSKQSAAKLLEKGDDDSEGVFGRSGEQGDLPESDPKFVNLNPETAFGPEVVTSFDFPNASLVDLTKHMQKLTGINLILDKDLKGTVSITAPTAITVGDAWKAYLTALNLNGYTLVKSGAFYKIVQARDIRYTSTKIYTGNYTPETENYAMRIIPLKNINSAEVTRSFRPFMSRYGRIIEIRQTNTIIVQDTGSHINRLSRLIKFIDVPGHEESLQIIPVEHSSAPELAKLLDQILRDSGGGSRPRPGNRPPSGGDDEGNISKIIAEPRTNSIIAMANAQGASQLRDLVKKLDVPYSAQAEGQIHVYYLNHGDAETIGETLSNLISGVASIRSGNDQDGRRTSRFSRDAQEGSSLFSENVKVTADKENNALVVTASPTDYLTIKNVISKLDIPRDQVYVEGMMMETQVSQSSSFGVSIIAATGSGNAQRAGFTGGNDDLLSLLTGNIVSLGGFFTGIGAGKEVEIPGPDGQKIRVNSINGLISALAANSNTNVLATPQILALDNTEAVFEVGEQIPTVERTNTPSGSQTSVKQQKVALTLKLTPQINKVTRFVRLKIDQKIEDFSGRQLPDGIASEGIATTLRNAVTTVVVRDQDTIAMGGLMRDRESSQTSKVPLLGDIPVIGWLFKNTSKTTEKVNLLFFLTPKILSPYESETAGTVKDVLNRRSTHLQDVQSEDDPFLSTAKGLYDKADEQAVRPLYDLEAAKKYRDQNATNTGVQGGSGAAAEGDYEVPNYRNILKDSQAKKKNQD